MSAIWTVILFACTKFMPALFRVVVAVVVWLFTFVEAHQAAILAALSFFGTMILKADSWAMATAKAGLAYFGTNAFAGLIRTLKGEAVDLGNRYVLKPLVDLRQVFADEFDRLDVAWHNLTFRPPANPPIGPGEPESAPATAN